MWWTDYIREIKKQFRDTYHFMPTGGFEEDPTFDSIPDGEYPMTIDGELDRVRIVGGKISCCNFDRDCMSAAVLADPSDERMQL